MLKIVEQYLAAGLSKIELRRKGLIDTLTLLHVKNQENARDHINTMLNAAEQIDDLAVAGRILKELTPWKCIRNEAGNFVFKVDFKPKADEMVKYQTVKELTEAIDALLDQFTFVSKQANEQAFAQDDFLTAIANTLKSRVKKLMRETELSYDDAVKAIRKATEAGFTQAKPTE